MLYHINCALLLFIKSFNKLVKERFWSVKYVLSSVNYIYNLNLFSTFKICFDQPSCQVLFRYQFSLSSYTGLHLFLHDPRISSRCRLIHRKRRFLVPKIPLFFWTLTSNSFWTFASILTNDTPLFLSWVTLSNYINLKDYRNVWIFVRNPYHCNKILLIIYDVVFFP